MKQVMTRDGSITWFNEELGEHYHSLAGAYEEAEKKHVAPVIEFLKDEGMLNTGHGKITVLDFCFGLGYNSLVFLEQVRKIDKETFIDIIGIDNDVCVVEESKRIFKQTQYQYIGENAKAALRIIIGDGAEEIRRLGKDSCITVCFFDPFSPKKIPHLWTADVFREIYNRMEKRAILSTYSCARLVRDNMKQAGFIVKDGPTIGRWCPSTLGVKRE